MKQMVRSIIGFNAKSTMMVISGQSSDKTGNTPTNNKMEELWQIIWWVLEMLVVESTATVNISNNHKLSDFFTFNAC